MQILISRITEYLTTQNLVRYCFVHFFGQVSVEKHNDFVRIQFLKKEVSFGAIVLGIGMVGMLKSAIEMADYHGKR